MYELRQLTSTEHAVEIACGLGALIDGFYIRQALHGNPLDREAMMDLVCDYLEPSLLDRAPQDKENR